MRRLVDMQYYYETDQVIVHEIVDGERTYSTINNPELVFGVKKPEFGAPRNDEFWIPKEQVEMHRCSYINRYREIAEVLGYDMNMVNSMSKESYSDFKRHLMANPHLFFADNSITFQEHVNYRKEHADDIDETMDYKIMSFDIEVHDDWNPDVYDLIRFLNLNYNNLSHVDYKSEIKRVTRYDQNDYLNALVNTVPAEEINIVDSSSFKEILCVIARDDVTEETLQAYIEYIGTKATYSGFESKIGFPHEEFAYSKVDAISAFDSIENKMWLFLLDDKVDKLNNHNWSHLINKESSGIVGEYVNEYLNMIKLRVTLRSDKDFRKNYPELLEALNNVTENYHEDILPPSDNTDAKLLCKNVFNAIKEALGEERYNSIMNINTEVRFFETELELLEDFFYTTRKVIRPNVILAHNNKFDFLTLYNRLKLTYHKVPELYFNQVGPFFTDDNIDEDTPLFPIQVKIDYRAKNNKQDSSFIKVAGCVWLDTQLLIAKMSARERDFSLDAVSSDELKENKFDFKGVIQELYSNNTKHFILYSSVDTMLVHFLNDFMGLVENFASVVSGTFSTWSEYSLKSIYLTNLIKYELFDKHGHITRVNRNRLQDKPDTKFKGAYVTDLAKVKTYGIHEGVYDLDASRMYPSAIMQNNVMTDKLLGQWEDLEFYRESLLMNKIAFGHKHLNMDSPAVLYDKL